MKTFSLEILTPSKSVYSGEVQIVTVPGTHGSFQILYNHAPIISTLEIGYVKIEDANGKLDYFACSGGVVEVTDNKVLVLSNSVESRNEVDKSRAEKAKQRAQERLAVKAEAVDTARAELALKRAINRLNLPS